MESLLIRERYKVIHVLYAEEDYAALEAVDIRDREQTLYLLNVYEGKYLKSYLGCFHQLRGCPAYREMFLWQDSLVAVFTYREGLSIDRVFFQGARLDWRMRMDAAGALFRQALAMWEYPPQISCAALLSDNIQILREERVLEINYAVRPLGELDRRELVLLLSDQIRKVLLQRWDSPVEERRFVRELCAGAERSAVGAYGSWIAAEPAIRAAYERIENKGSLGKWLYLLFMNLRDWGQRRLKRKRGGSGR